MGLNEYLLTKFSIEIQKAVKTVFPVHCFARCFVPNSRARFARIPL